MDELTIGDTRYVSTKKAAQITGYAKDYVGQLCREGKVDAKLVGRNWYVLENSILEHRFGDEEIKEPVKRAEEAPDEYRWSSPIYTPEPVESLPEPPTSPIAESVPVTVQDTPKYPISDMQNAWKEWFSAKETDEKLLPDGSDMLISDEIESENVGNSEYFEPVSIRRQHFDEISTLPERDREVKEENKVQIHLRRDESSQAGTKTINKIVPQSSKVERTPKTRSARVAPRPVRITKVIFIAILGLIVAGTVASIQLIPRVETGRGNTFTNYISGVSTVE